MQDPLGKQGIRVSGGDLGDHAEYAECVRSRSRSRSEGENSEDSEEEDCLLKSRRPVAEQQQEPAGSFGSGATYKRFDAIATPGADGCSSTDTAKHWTASASGSLNASGVTFKQASSGLCLGVVVPQPVAPAACGSQVTVIGCDKPGAKWQRVADPGELGAFALISELNHQPLDLYGGDPDRRWIDIQTCTSPPMKTNNLWKLSAAVRKRVGFCPLSIYVITMTIFTKAANPTKEHTTV